MITLYQFPISHYCEKVRWALDYKGLKYQLSNLLPGLHVKQTKKLALRSTVPILQHDNKIIQGSNHIISYLDTEFPENSLTPEDPGLKNQAMDWERYVDEEIGIHVRRCLYHILLEHPDIVIPFFAHDGPAYGKILLQTIYPVLKKRMRKKMDINDTTAQQSRKHLNMAIDQLDTHLQQHDYLVGDQFTRADLTAAALLAPFCMPIQYGLIWPDEIPEPLTNLTDTFRQRITWVEEFYFRFR
jgi:glutathione S-transferase